ncbi:MAG: hypothetical protein ABSG68_26070 [Thermoguttaceae bacterium]
MRDRYKIVNEVALALHILSLAVGCPILFLFYLFPQRTSHVETIRIVGLEVIAVLFALGFMTGLAVMATKKGRSESIILAISTIFAFLLFLVALG